MSWKDIPGRAAYLWLYDEFVASAPQDAVVVEVGVALGKSIAYLARKCIDARRDDIIIYAVDPWMGTARNGEQQADGPPTADGDWRLFNRMMYTHAPEERDRIVIVRETSVRGATSIPYKSHLVVLDAGHDYADVKADLEAWVPRIHSGGAIGGDDWVPDFPGVERAVREYFPDHDTHGHIEVRHDEGWGSWRVKL